jgi:hypothetical protein
MNKTLLTLLFGVTMALAPVGNVVAQDPAPVPAPTADESSSGKTQLAETLILEVDMFEDSPEAIHRACSPTVPDDCSLRGAIIRGNATSSTAEIHIPPGTYTVTMTTSTPDLMLTGDLDVYKTMTIIGANAQGVIIVAPNGERVLEVSRNSTLTMSGVTLNNAGAGGISVEAGSALKLNDSLISTAGGFAIVNEGGAVQVDGSMISAGGGIANANGGVLTVVGTTISGNTGRGIQNYHSRLFVRDSKLLNNTGEGIGNDGFQAAAELINTEIARNQLGGIYNYQGRLTVMQSAIVENVSATRPGGGIYVDNAHVTIVNTTISLNASGEDGGGGGIHAIGGQIELNNSTLAFNKAVSGGALSIIGGSTVKVNNTILANSAASSECLRNGGVLSGDYNLASDGSCFAVAQHNLANTDPLLEPLALNSGLTQNHALKPNSPAIGGGNPAAPGSDADACATSDQRAVARPQPAGGRCDIGAFELEGGTPPPQMDDFSSANHPGGALGSAWLGDVSTANYSVVNDQLDIGTGGPVYWRPQVFGAGQRAAVMFVHVDTTNLQQALLLKVQGDDWTNGAIAASYDSSAHQISVEIHVPGTGWTTLATWAAVLRDGDQFSAVANADGNVHVFVNDAEVGNTNAGAFFAGKGGRAGLWFVNAEEAILDDFIAETTETLSMKQTFLPILTK